MFFNLNNDHFSSVCIFFIHSTISNLTFIHFIMYYHELMKRYPKKAIVTGFSSGIGFKYAEYLINEGWEVFGISRNIKNARNASEKLGIDIKNVYTCDLSNSNSILEITESIKAPQLIVLNAGIAINGPSGTNSAKTVRDAIYLMFGGVIDLIEHYLPVMINNNKGRIVIISSIGALIPMPKSAIYAAIKSGIYSYGKSLNEEISDTNVSITVSLPGYVKTNIHKKSGLEHLTRNIPKWMWITALQVVQETEKASRKGKSYVIPGFLYRISSFFFNFKITKIIWKKINARK